MREFNNQCQEILKNSEHTTELMDLVAFTEEKMNQFEIYPSDIQWTALLNHLNEMLKRAKNNEKIQEIDEAMFSEVSKEALEVSREVVEKVSNLPKDEVFILSIHFEAAKYN